MDKQRFLNSAPVGFALARQRHGAVDGIPLPPLALRMGGANFREDHAFLAGGDRDLARLEDLVGLDDRTQLLDLGSGSGRLAIAIARKYGCLARYVGVEVQPTLVRWCKKNLPTCFDFVYSDAANDRYNPTGSSAKTLPLAPGFTVAYAYSVFSHMIGSDVAAYLAELRRLLVPGGKAWFTAFVEEGVEPESENPEGYGAEVHTGRLHVVRFDRDHFESLITQAGFEVLAFDHASDTNGQSSYVLRALPAAVG